MAAETGIAETGVPAPARLDPRVLAAGTTARFVLLLAVLAASCLSMLTGLNVGDRLAPRSAGNNLECLLAVGVDPDGSHVGNLVAIARGSDMLARCESGASAVSFRVGLAGTGAVLLAALAVYWVLPSWKGRRRRVLPLSAVDPDGTLAAHLTGLVARAGLTRAPRFVVDPRALSAGAVVFGRLRRHTVCLHGGLVARRAPDPEAFDAVVLHELAHLHNRDVDITYATVALWRVFLVAALLPFAVQQGRLLVKGELLGTDSMFWLGARPQLLRDVAFSAFLCVLVYLARADILRSRELYADLDAVARGADAAAWRFADRADPAGSGIARSFRSLWRTHPTWQERRRALSDPARLFAVDALPLFLTGAATVALADMLPVGLLGVRGAWNGQVRGWLAAGIVTVVVTVAVWRAVVHAVATGRPAPSGLRAGLALGLGMLLGELMLARTGGNHFLPARPWVLLVPVLAATVSVWWSAQWAELWLRSWRGRTARPALLLGLPVTWCVFAGWFTWWNDGGYLYAVGDLLDVPQWLSSLPASGPLPGWVHALLTGGYPVAVGLLTNRTLAVGGAAMWLLPLLLWAWRRPAGAPPWVATALSGTAEPAYAPAPAPPPRRVALAAVAGGVACWAAQLGAMAYLHAWQPPVRLRNGVFGLGYVTLHLFVLLLGISVAAAVAAATVRRYGLLVALVAAGTAGLLGVAGEYVLLGADGCLGPMDVLARRCVWHPAPAWILARLWPPLVLGAGMYVAAVAALAAAGLARLRRGTGRGSRAVRSVPSFPARRVLAGVVSAGAVALLVTGRFGTGPAQSTDVGKPGIGLVAGPRTAVTDRVRRWQVIAWTSEAGGTVQLEFAGAIQAFADALLEAAQHGDGHTVKLDRAVFTARCQAIERAVTKAQALPPFPDTTGQQRLTSMLTEARTGVALCLRAFAEDNGRLLLDASTHYEAALTAGRDFADLLGDYVAQAEAAAGK